MDRLRDRKAYVPVVDAWVSESDLPDKTSYESGTYGAVSKGFVD